MSIQTIQGGGVSVSGRDSVNLFAAMAVKSALSLYIKTGMKANRAYTPTNMRAFVTRHTGKTYKARELQQAHDDLVQWIEDAKKAEQAEA